MDIGYGLWIRSKKPENLTELEAMIIIYTTKCTFFMQGACYIQKVHHIHLDMYLGQIGYRILDIVPSCVNRA